LKDVMFLLDGLKSHGMCWIMLYSVSVTFRFACLVGV
jgi:hypothetical protein